MVFHDGAIGVKYLVLLNTPTKNDPYVFVKVTSQRKDKSINPGCSKKDSSFFIQGGKTFFLKDTWAQLYELYPIPQKNIHGNDEVKYMGSLDAKTIGSIIDCLFLSEDDNISPIIKKLIRPPMQDCLLKLQEKFKK